MCRVLNVVAIVALAFSGGCGKSAATKFDTPEAAFEAFQEATEAEDWQTAAHCLTPDSQAMMADSLVLLVSFSAGTDDQKQKEVAALLKKHGMDLDADPGPAAKSGEGDIEISAAVKDKPALIGELMAWAKKNKGSDDFALRLKNIGKVTVDGDKASAMVETDRGQRPIGFVRGDGGWLVSMTDDAGRAGRPDFDPDADINTPDAKSAEGPASEPGAGRGTLWVGGKAHELRYAVAYKTAHFDEPCTAVLLTARPLSQASLNLLKKVLADEGHDMGFFAPGVSLRLLFDADGKPLYLFAWAENVSLNSSSEIEAQIAERDGRVIGKAAKKEDETLDEKIRYRFDVEFDVALLPFAVKPIEKPDTELKETERAATERSQADRTEATADTPPDSEREEATKDTKKASEAPAEPAKPAEPAVTVDDTPRQPATVEEAVRLLDLRKFPLVLGAQFLSQRRQVGQLSYQRIGDLATVFEFQRKHLKELGWQELTEGLQTVESGNPRALYTRDGFLVSMSVGMYVSIENHGNVLVGKLPVPPGVQPHYGDLTRASYVTSAPTEETREACHKMLLDKGWKPYGKAEKTTYFKWNAVHLSADVRSFDNQPGKTYITYSTELMSADLPAPADANDPRYTDSMKELRFQASGNAVGKLAAFYKEELDQQGFKPTTEPIGDQKVALVFRNDAKDMITLDMNVNQDLTWVVVRHYSAAEVAEMDRLHKEAVAKRVKLEEEARRAGEEDLIGADLEWLEKELARRKAIPKIAVPIPGKAKKVEQRNSENIEITVSLRAGKTIVEALARHFEASGWKQVEAKLDDDEGGSLRLSKGDASLKFEYRDWFGSDEIDIDAENVKLEPSRDVAEFAALGGVVAGAPPPAELLANAPSDIPVPADARELSINVGANVHFEVAGDMKTLAAYFHTAMVRHGWTYDARSSRIDGKMASLNFEKNRRPCGISLVNVFGGEFTTVTIAGGGMNWSRLRGARAAADPAVAAELAAAKTKAVAPKSKALPPKSNAQPKTVPNRSR
jgi:hypothetical protein